VIRVAAVGDIHLGLDSAGTLRPHLRDIGERADVFCIAGDLTKHGDPEEAAVLADELADVAVPVVCVLGNHDYHTDREGLVRKVLEESGVTVLEGEHVVLDIDGTHVGVAGTKGFGGGFMGASGSDFGEPEQKAFVRHSQKLAHSLEEQLTALDTPVKIALMHFSPVEETLAGERLEIYPFLGSYYLAEAIDNGGADIALHGHAHVGSEKGVTPGGVPVRNVAQPVLQHAYKVYCVGGAAGGDCEPTVSP
jgi:Icc-related predicted phosphoesterase